MKYQRAGVASTFSPTFAAVIAEADAFAHHCGAGLEIIHAAAFDSEKEKRFLAALGRKSLIRWVEAESPARAIIGAAYDYQYQLLIAGALQTEDTDRSFTSSVARELLRRAPCDLLLVPRPQEAPAPLRHMVFAADPGDDVEDFLQRVVAMVQPRRVTIAVTETPFAAAIAASRGETPGDLEEWLERIAAPLEGRVSEIEARVIRSNTGYTLCDVIHGLEADILVVRARPAEEGDPLPMHMGWLYQVIPTRLLVAKDRGKSRA